MTGGPPAGRPGDRDHHALGPGREFDAVRALMARWGDLARGIGDDAAVLDVPPGERLVVSVDSSVEDRHFRRAWLTPEEIGYRAATAALSDLAAMGARPLGMLVALALPTAWRGGSTFGAGTTVVTFERRGDAPAHRLRLDQGSSYLILERQAAGAAAQPARGR